MGALVAVSERREFDAREVLIDTRNRRRGMFFLVLSGEVLLPAAARAAGLRPCRGPSLRERGWMEAQWEG